MKHCNKIVSYVVLLSVVFVMVQTISLFGLFHVAFKSVEKYVARKNLQFCVNSLQAQLNHLNGIAFEWSAWDDTGLFIEGQKPEYLGENMTENTLREKKLDVICIVDKQGKPLWSRCVKNSDNETQAIELEMLSPQNLQKNVDLWNHKSTASCISGYIATENGVLMLSSRPVTNNTNSPPIHGTIIVGRFITDQIIASIARQTCLDFKWWNLRSEYTKKAVTQYTSKISPANPVYVEFEIDSAAAYTTLPDIYKNDAVLVKFLLTNELALYRDQLAIKSSGIYFVEGFLFLACLALMVNGYCRKHTPQPMETVHEQPEVEYISFEQMSDIQNSQRDAVLTGEKQP